MQTCCAPGMLPGKGCERGKLDCPCPSQPAGAAAGEQGLVHVAPVAVPWCP